MDKLDDSVIGQDADNTARRFSHIPDGVKRDYFLLCGMSCVNYRLYYIHTGRLHADKKFQQPCKNRCPGSISHNDYHVQYGSGNSCKYEQQQRVCLYTAYLWHCKRLTK